VSWEADLLNPLRTAQTALYIKAKATSTATLGYPGKPRGNFKEPYTDDERFIMDFVPAILTLVAF
jgi:hypothetical protein